MNITDYLKSIGMDPTPANIEAIAKQMGVTNYKTNPQILINKIEAKYKNDARFQAKKEQFAKATQMQNLANTQNKNKGKSIDMTKSANIEGLRKAKKKGLDVNALANQKGMYYNEQKKSFEQIPNGVEYDENTKKLIEKYQPVDPIFEQYKQFEISDEERKNIQNTERSYKEVGFNQQRDRTTTDYNIDKDIINRLIGYSKTDSAIELTKMNKTFANTMTKATNAYGKRNLLDSGIQIANANEGVGNLEKDVQNRMEYDRRQQEGYTDKQINIKTIYERGVEDINQNQDAQMYFDTINTINNRKTEYNRAFEQSQQFIKPTTPTTPTDPLTQDEINKRNNLM